MRLTLKEARISAGKTQNEIAKEIGISKRHYQNIESGAREGKGYIWDKLEALFSSSQRILREQNSSSPQLELRGKKVLP